ncbi:hypothetical protein WA158_006499 [Blastocystis sp. Blastoise]
MNSDSFDLESAIQGLKNGHTHTTPKYGIVESVNVSSRSPESIKREIAKPKRSSVPYMTDPQTPKSSSYSQFPSANVSSAKPKHFADGKVPTWVEEDLKDLSDEQKKAYLYCLLGYNVFFTGDAGTGKSYVLKKIVNMKKQLHSENSIYVTASTGIAACNIGGITLHSFAGIGLGDKDVTFLHRKIRSNKKCLDRWKQCEVLFIDEISMLDGHLFDTLEYLARKVRNNNNPFGGIQVILCGDFFQLPPVGLGRDGVIYCFQANCWKTTIQRYICLKTVYRQKDTKLQQLLREIRHGTVSASSLQLIAAMENTNLDIEKDIKPTRRHLSDLAGNIYRYIAKDSGEEIYVNLLKKGCSAPETLDLKIGAQVMLLKNLDVERGLVNGMRGVVTRFIDISESAAISSSEDEDPANSEARDNQSQMNQSLSPSKNSTPAGNRLFVVNIGQKNSVTYMPIVKFALPAGETEVAIESNAWEIEGGRDKPLAQREQIPIKLAWAMSIHKSQGMSIDLLEIDLNGVFEKGMTYVAMSRGVDINRMRVRGFDRKNIHVDTTVERFYQETEQKEAKDSINYQAFISKLSFEVITSSPKKSVSSPSKSYSSSLPPLPPLSASVRKPFKSPRENKVASNHKSLMSYLPPALATNQYIVTSINEKGETVTSVQTIHRPSPAKPIPPSLMQGRSPSVTRPINSPVTPPRNSIPQYVPTSNQMNSHSLGQSQLSHSSIQNSVSNSVPTNSFHSITTGISFQKSSELLKNSLSNTNKQFHDTPSTTISSFPTGKSYNLEGSPIPPSLNTSYIPPSLQCTENRGNIAQKERVLSSSEKLEHSTMITNASSLLTPSRDFSTSQPTGSRPHMIVHYIPPVVSPPQPIRSSKEDTDIDSYISKLKQKQTSMDLNNNSNNSNSSNSYNSNSSSIYNSPTTSTVSMSNDDSNSLQTDDYENTLSDRLIPAVLEFKRHISPLKSRGNRLSISKKKGGNIRNEKKQQTLLNMFSKMNEQLEQLNDLNNKHLCN